LAAKVIVLIVVFTANDCTIGEYYN